MTTLGKKNIKFRVGVSFLLFPGSIVGLNWLNLASVFPFIATDLKLNVSSLGSVTAVFVIGEGLFQIPAALVAGKYSQKKIIIFGTVGAALSTLLIGAADSVTEFELLRFAVRVPREGTDALCEFFRRVMIAYKLTIDTHNAQIVHAEPMDC